MNINHILVVGSGIMGSGIAYASALGGIETTLYDVEEESLEKAKTYHKEMLNKGVAPEYYFGRGEKSSPV